MHTRQRFELQITIPKQIAEEYGIAPGDEVELVPAGARRRRCCGYPGVAGIGPKTAARLLERYGRIEDFPLAVLGEHCELALLFKNPATLRTDAELFADVDDLRWRGPTPSFAAYAAKLRDERLLARCAAAAGANAHASP